MHLDQDDHQDQGDQADQVTVQKTCFLINSTFPAPFAVLSKPVAPDNTRLKIIAILG